MACKHTDCDLNINLYWWLQNCRLVRINCEQDYKVIMREFINQNNFRIIHFNYTIFISSYSRYSTKTDWGRINRYYYCHFVSHYGLLISVFRSLPKGGPNFNYLQDIFNIRRLLLMNICCNIHAHKVLQLFLVAFIFILRYI